MSAEANQTDAREAFLALRDAVGLPRGGEVVHRPEVEQVAEHFGLDYEDWTKRRIIYELVSRHVYGRSDRSWEDARDGARDYVYLQSREARRLAEAAEEVNEFDWQDKTDGEAA